MIIERLDPQRHQREVFSCGEPSLDQFLHAHARKYYERGLGVTWVAVADDTSTRIDGYYTLSMNALLADELQSPRVRLVRIPIMLLGRLAVDSHTQGSGLGTQLLMHAMYTAYHLSQLIGMHGILVDPLTDRVARWYARYGFIPLPGAPRRLLLPISTLRPLITQISGASQVNDIMELARELSTNNTIVKS